jgi:4-amino-4-deoxy-L-arabinose transferase-like glycosyltransferase
MFAEAAREMLATGDWITPYYNQNFRFDKPALVYWLMAISYKIVGVNAWGARLPSALAAIALMVMLFFVLKRFGFPTADAAAEPEKALTQRKLWLAGWIGSALFALNFQNLVWGRSGVSDMLLNACMGAGLISFFYGYATGGKAINRWLPNGWYLLSYACLGLAVLTKGPVGIALPGLIIIAFLVYLGRFWSVFLEAKPLVGAVVFSVVAIPWYVLVILKNGQTYIDAFFGYHNFDRFTGVVNGHDAPIYFYFPVVLISFIPWSVFIPAAIARLKLHHIQEWRQQPRHAHLGLFACTWFVVIFVFFTIAVTKLPSYTLPLLPAASILVALLWSQMIHEPQQPSKFFWWSSAVNVLFLVILAVFLYISPRLIGYDPAAPNLDQDFADSLIPELGAVLWAIAALGGILCLFALKSRLGLLITNVITFTLFISCVLIPTSSFLDQHRQAGLRDIANGIKTLRQPQEEVVMIGFEKPSLVFYSEQHIQFFNLRSQAIDYIYEHQKESNDTILVIGKDNFLDDFSANHPQVQILTEGFPYKLVRLSKATPPR